MDASIKGKFKLHKINGIDINVCSAEQMVAYNLAHNIYLNHIDNYKSCEFEYQRTNICINCIAECINTYMLNTISKMFHGEKHDTYDANAVYFALHAGMRAYFDNSHCILGFYEDVGRIFNLDDFNATQKAR